MMKNAQDGEEIAIVPDKREAKGKMEQGRSGEW
jgi:hypothetical protein